MQWAEKQTARYIIQNQLPEEQITDPIHFRGLLTRFEQRVSQGKKHPLEEQPEKAKQLADFSGPFGGVVRMMPFPKVAGECGSETKNRHADRE